MHDLSDRVDAATRAATGADGRTDDGPDARGTGGPNRRQMAAEGTDWRDEMTTGTLRGRFVWYELLTSDPAAAQAFYTNIVGWGTKPFEGSDMPYTMWVRGESAIGGVMALPDEAKSAGAPPNWLMYVGTEDVDATHRQVLELGGRSYVAPQDIPNVGRFAVVADPQGATFAMYTPRQAANAPETAPGEGQFSWHELVTTDLDAAFRFYNTLFGWTIVSDNDMGPMGIYRVFGRGGQQVGGMFNKPPEMPAPPHWLLYVRVGDIAATVAAVKAGGGQVLHGPVEVPGGHQIAQCLDPQGAAFALHQL
jgi:predicted enzyme related to lactoylglutathione lyase